MRNLPNRSRPRAPRWTSGCWDEWSRRIWRYSRTTELPLSAPAHGVHQPRSSEENECGHDHAGQQGCVAGAVSIEDQCQRNSDSRHENQETDDQCRHATIHEVAVHAQIRRSMAAGKNPRRDSGVDSSEDDRSGGRCPGGCVLRQDSKHDPSCGKADPVPRRHIDFGDHLLTPLLNRVQRQSSLCFCDSSFMPQPLTFLVGKSITFQLGKSTNSILTGARPPARPQGGLPDHRASGEAKDGSCHDVPGVVHPVVDPAVTNDSGQAIERQRKLREVGRHSGGEGEGGRRMARRERPRRRHRRTALTVEGRTDRASAGKQTLRCQVRRGGCCADRHQPPDGRPSASRAAYQRQESGRHEPNAGVVGGVRDNGHGSVQRRCRCPGHGVVDRVVDRIGLLDQASPLLAWRRERRGMPIGPLGTPVRRHAGPDTMPEGRPMYARPTAMPRGVGGSATIRLRGLRITFAHTITRGCPQKACRMITSSSSIASR